MKKFEMEENDEKKKKKKNTLDKEALCERLKIGQFFLLGSSTCKISFFLDWYGSQHVHGGFCGLKIHILLVKDLMIFCMTTVVFLSDVHIYN